MQLSITAQQQQYDIHIGSGLLQTPSLFEGFRRVAIVTDENVAALYLARLHAALEGAGAKPCEIILPAGETIKSEQGLFSIYDGLIEAGISRADAVVALGGGTVGDAAGFAAATYLRGVPLIQCPTTLLAQCDAGIGGKTAIDHPRGKNLIGAFYQPKLVVCDTDALLTLPAQHLASGMAEVIKCACIADESLLAIAQAGELAQMVYCAASIKAGYVQADLLDTGVRRELNFGHTIGHALERVSGYHCLHGFAVAAGMRAMATIGESLGITKRGTSLRLNAALDAAGLTFTLAGADMQALSRAMLLDKKGDGENIEAVFLERIGKARIFSLPFDELIRLVSELSQC